MFTNKENFFTVCLNLSESLPNVCSSFSPASAPSLSPPSAADIGVEVYLLVGEYSCLVCSSSDLELLKGWCDESDLADDW